ncbi:hypothetical protein FQB35_08340 [Crassaminicella thermophila]|uniref:Uncharacterized protein n=1 Tax=Crassaminicella thermophila TaxID=2599308 RepID=A0A5C0SCY6_CRATE|nr:hypothetical protein [Crassaminicella thermophila]QEK12383.1 hypothetical protein FQB35_08340 [Crassaminicella thermophila]
MNVINIFFPTENLRNYYVKKVFNLKEMMQDENFQYLSIPGIKSIKFKSKYKKTSGYWVKIELNDESAGKLIKNKIYDIIPHFWIEQHVFFPMKLIPQREMEELWIQKYNLINEGTDSDAWKNFLKEGKNHFKEGRIDIAKAVFMCIYKNNPFFLKKYKRYYVFEDLAYAYEEKGELYKKYSMFESSS